MDGYGTGGEIIARRPQAKRSGKEERMVRHGLRPVGVSGEGGGRNIQLRRQPLDKGVDRLLHLRQAYAGMAQRGQLHGKTQAMGGAAAAHHEVLIGSGKDVMPRQGVRITRHAKEQLAFFVPKQRSTRHCEARNRPTWRS
jgi:hypothetical protein